MQILVIDCLKEIKSPSLCHVTLFLTLSSLGVNNYISWVVFTFACILYRFEICRWISIRYATACIFPTLLCEVRVEMIILWLIEIQ